MGHADGDQETALAYQRGVLPDVSRTFALTIPELPASLELAVGNAYLLCRIADTIEDDPEVDDGLRRQLHAELVSVLEQNRCARSFADRASAALGDATSASERTLVQDMPRVVGIYRQLSQTQQAAISTCVVKMCEGMPEYQHSEKAGGLDDMIELDRYCYHVAGVVGELLTELFCEHSDAIDAHRPQLFALAASFGQGLQLTNIIKDVWDDHARGYCWLPRDIFNEQGYDLDQLAPDHDRKRFRAGLEQLLGIAHGHLQNALHYTLLIPRSESGIRRFCLWAIGLALLTLRRVRANPDYVSPNDVKVSRRAVAMVVVCTRLTSGSDRALRALFRLAAQGLPRAPTNLSAMALGSSRAAS